MSTAKSTVKRILWKWVAKGWPGSLARHFDTLVRDREILFGLRNPMHMKYLFTRQAGNLYLAELDSHMSQGSARKKLIRFDPDGFEDDIVFLMDALVEPEHTVLDIGANNGYHTVLLAKKAHKGHVFAFEPLAKFAEQTSVNSALNGVGNVTIVNCALGAEAAELEMKVNVSGRGLQGTSTFIDDNQNVIDHPDDYVTRTVKVHRLDDIVRTLHIPSRIGFIKIDTEGFDTMVLEGAMETIRKHRPIMTVEAHTRRLAQAGKSWQWYLDTFPDYHILIIYPLTRAKPYLHLEPLTADLPEISVNLLMLPRRAILVPEG